MSRWHALAGVALAALVAALPAQAEGTDVAVNAAPPPVTPIFAPAPDVTVEAGFGAAPGAAASLSLPAFSPGDFLTLAIEERLAGRPADDPVASFYTSRGHAPLFIEGERLGPVGRAVRDRLARADEDGLVPAAYSVDMPPRGASDPDAFAAAEIAMAEAALAYAVHAQIGRVDPAGVSRFIAVTREAPDARRVLAGLAAARDAGAELQSYNPPHEGYRLLRGALSELRAAMAAPQARIQVPEGPVLRVGVRDTRVAALRSRLGIMSDAEPETYDPELEAAVREYQRAKGIGVDGVVGPQTLRMLNATPADRKADIVANMERWRWLARDLGRHHVKVNVPDYMLSVVEDGKPTYTGRVIVGTVRNQTPIFSHEISHVVVNPYWNVPTSIATGDILASARQDPYWLTRNGYEVLHNGRVIDPGRVDWHQVGRGNMPVRIRQVPSERNALGRVKFMFPNDHAVYLHDTPQKGLFDRTMRAFSHGCVRVQNPFEFAEALLALEPQLNADRLKGMLGSRERWVSLETNVPVHLTYFTTFVDEVGHLQVRDDIYGHDGQLKAALGLAG